MFQGASGRSFKQTLKLLNPLELFRFRNIEDKGSACLFSSAPYLSANFDVSFVFLAFSLKVQKKLQKMAVVFFLNMLLFSGLECSLLFLAQLRFGYTG